MLPVKKKLFIYQSSINKYYYLNTQMSNITHK